LPAGAQLLGGSAVLVADIGGVLAAALAPGFRNARRLGTDAVGSASGDVTDAPATSRVMPPARLKRSIDSDERTKHTRGGQAVQQMRLAV